MKMTRQQRRQIIRQRNKFTVRSAKKAKNSTRNRTGYEDYQLNSTHLAELPLCFVFNDNKTKLQDFINSCREVADTLIDAKNYHKYIVLIRKPDTALPAPKPELMKIATRLFQKVAPNLTYIFVEANGTGKTADIPGSIRAFQERLDTSIDAKESLNWLGEYIHKEKTEFYEVDRISK